MAFPYIGEIRMFAGNFAPVGWMTCAGQLLPISQYETLFQLIGTTYGGDGQSTFALPDLRGRVPIHFGAQHVIGDHGGSEAVTLTTQQLPEHTHMVRASTQAATAGTPAGNVPATTPGSTRLYAFASGSSSANMSPLAVSSVGSSAPHENRMPYLTITFIICVEGGIFPSPS